MNLNEWLPAAAVFIWLQQFTVLRYVYISMYIHHTAGLSVRFYFVQIMWDFIGLQILIIQLLSTQQLLCMCHSPMLVICLTYVSKCRYFYKHVSHCTTESSCCMSQQQKDHGGCCVHTSSRWQYSTYVIKPKQTSL